MLKRILIANRGEIACRIIRTIKQLGMESVAVYSEADRDARHVLEADQAWPLGGQTAADSYLSVQKILEAARNSGAQAIHPGYGFLSENADFAEACSDAGIIFVGPTPSQLRDFGLKHTARALAKNSQVPLLPGTELLPGLDQATEAADRIGYPVMLKSTAGGGGIGMRLCHDQAELREAFQAVRNLGQKNFADDGIFLEKFVQQARHIEVQIFGDGQGEVVALGERDCSVQRRNQKVIEETPAPNLDPALRAELLDAAVRLGQAVNYRSAGTVEFVFDPSVNEFYFLEVNTRLQVEHGVTENVTGIDLVEWMLRLAGGKSDFLTNYIPPKNDGPLYSIQARVYAEDPAKNFQPSSGLLTKVVFPQAPQVRVDAWIESGSQVSHLYDPLLAKVIVTAPSRPQAVAGLLQALKETEIYGIQTNIEYLKKILATEAFGSGQVFTQMLTGLHFEPAVIDVLSPGMQTTVQDYPGRLGWWQVGIPPSGPMDPLAFRLGNRLLGNPTDAAGLEMTVTGPVLKFGKETIACLTGAKMTASLDGQTVPWWETFTIAAGATLKLGSVEEHGSRAYLTVAGGLDVAEFLGSKSTFTLGEFGGHGGRALRTGDVLAINPTEGAQTTQALGRQSLQPDYRPEYANRWEIKVLYGPHGAPDFFTNEDIDIFFSTDYEVHYNSARTGVRLIGPKPKWARADGGEAGLHPSNIHDNAYAVGTIDFTGDMPIILGPDGPSLGGFVCPATIIQADLWKAGQLRPGDLVRFIRVSAEQAAAYEADLNRGVDTLGNCRLASPRHLDFTALPADAIQGTYSHTAQPEVTYRQAGDRYLLVEYGPLVLDFSLRFRVHQLMQAVAGQKINGIIDLTPGIRSLQIHYDSLTISRGKLLDLLRNLEQTLSPVEDMEVESRTVYLPLSWNDPQTVLATEKYMQSVWPDAPWCPSNLEFIRRINGLESQEQVKQLVFEAEYLVLGLGDVYLGAPVATPVDPRHRLVTTKYNPARTWTPQNAVGIGGAYLCVYGMEGPGGYQFVGRTCQVWNSWRTTKNFPSGSPYLLRFFDRIRFFEVTSEELQDFRRDFPTGRVEVTVDPGSFSLAKYKQFLADNAESIHRFQDMQQRAFAAEREHWKTLPPPPANQKGNDQPLKQGELPAYAAPIDSPMHANIWKVLVKPGQKVKSGDNVIILEAMKMEVPMPAPVDGTVQQVLAGPGAAVAPGQRLLVLDTRNQ